jgi:hypothetical protein
MTTSPRLIVCLPIGRVELGHRLDPAQSLSLAAWDKTGDLNGHASTNRGQTRIGDDRLQRFHLDLRLSTAFYDGFVVKIRYWLVEAVRRSAPYLPA